MITIKNSVFHIINNQISDIDLKPTFRTSLIQLIKAVNYHKSIYLMLLPGVAFLVIFRYLPMYGLQVAFKDYNLMKGLADSQWVGFRYFEMAFTSSVFWSTFTNTFLLSFYSLVVNFIASVVLALLLNEVRCAIYKKIVQTVSYLPYFLSWVIIAVFTFSIFGSENGAINKILEFLGHEPILFYQTPGVWRTILTSLNMWKLAGWGTIIYLASISGISPDLYECAEIDGANRFKKVMYITIPQLLPVMFVILILSSASLVQGNFEQVYAIIGENAAIRDKVDIMETYIYRIGLVSGQFSFSAAIGFFKAVIGAVMIFVTNYLAGRLQDDAKFRLW